MATAPAYATVDQCAQALDIRASAHQVPILARLGQTASRGIDRITRRRFYPLTATRTWRVPARSGELWLPDDLISASAVSFDGVAVTGYALEPRFSGPPFNRLDLTDATIGYAAPSTVVSVTGDWGFRDDSASAGALASSPDADDVTITVTDSSLVGIGDQLTIGTERMVVTARALADTTADLAGSLVASTAETSIPVTDGTKLHEGEFITVDSEVMEVVAIASNTLTVRRAQDGSTLATHTNGAGISAPRLLTVVRAASGSTAASHTAAAAITRNSPEPKIVEWCVAEVLVLIGQERAGFSMTVGEGDTQQEATGAQFGKLRKEALDLYRRRKYGAV